MPGEPGVLPYSLYQAAAAGRRVTIVFPSERDCAAVDIKQPAVGEGHAMGVAAEVIQDLFRTAEGRLRIDDLFGLVERSRYCVKAWGSRSPSREEKKCSWCESKASWRCSRNRRLKSVA